MMCVYNPITGFLYFIVVLFWERYWLCCPLVNVEAGNPVTDRVLWYFEYSWFRKAPCNRAEKG